MREAKIIRKTNETDIKLWLNIDGNGKSNIKTGIGFFDHMLILFAKHAMVDLDITCIGDTQVDSHHTIEDVGIALGDAINKALDTKYGTTRYGTFFLPMDEALVMCSIDLSGREYFVFDAQLNCQKLGEFETEMTEDFFRAISNNAKMTLHIKCLYGRNTHHIIEAAFKAFARAFDEATTIDPRVKGIPSTKGSL